MARVPWNFAGYDWPVNPDKDSEWRLDPLVNEHNPLEGRVSHFQFTARKSQRRTISGWLAGPYADSQLTMMTQWRDNKTRGILRDHTGRTKSCFLLVFEVEPVLNQISWRKGQQSYRYNAEFVEV